jgi:putative addiction module CopG family antidote
VAGNTTMNVSLPEPLKDYVLERVAEGTYSNPSDYVRSLIREDMRRRARERLDALLLEGLESGPARRYASSRSASQSIGRAGKRPPAVAAAE